MAELPEDARQLGGRVRDGLGEYYRELLALSRVLEQNAQGNWVAKYVDGGKADHYAHAESYCALALKHRSSRNWTYFESDEEPIRRNGEEVDGFSSLMRKEF
jgi:hypothetical protein